MSRCRLGACGSVAVVLAAIVAACNTRTPVDGLEAPSVSVPTSPTVPGPPRPPSQLFSLTFKPGAVYAGSSTTGTALLAVQAPAGGVEVSLDWSDPAVTMPRSVVVAEGKDSATFPVSTDSIPSDRDATIVGSAGGRSVSGTLPLWTILPTFFSFVSDAGDPVGKGLSKRLTPSTARFTAWCNASQVTVTIDGPADNWRTTFAAPKGTHLGVGTYENAATASVAPSFPQTDGPEMSVSGNGSGCSSIGRFIVRESDITSNGRVNRFWATFEQRCIGRTEVLQGDVRVIAPAPTTTSLTCR